VHPEFRQPLRDCQLLLIRQGTACRQYVGGPPQRIVDRGYLPGSIQMTSTATIMKSRKNTSNAILLIPRLGTPMSGAG